MLEKLLPERPARPEANDDHEEVELHAYHGSTNAASSYDDDDDEMGGHKVQCAQQWSIYQHAKSCSKDVTCPHLYASIVLLLNGCYNNISYMGYLLLNAGNTNLGKLNLSFILRYMFVIIIYFCL